MLIKKQKLVSLAIIGVSLVAAVFILYSSNKFSWLKEQCIQLRSHKALIKVRYPDEFFAMPYDNEIQISIKDISQPGHKKIILNVWESCCYASIETLIEDAKIEFPRNEYNKGIFNGHEAMIFVENNDGEIWENYDIPIGDALIEIIYSPSLLSEEEKTKAEKMLRGITLTEAKEDIKEARVEACS